VNKEQRLRIGSIGLAVGILGLSAASLGILSPMPGLETKLGRHLCAGALANLALTLLISVVAAIPLRQGHRWAFWACLIPIVVYSIPILIIDAIYVTPAHRVVTLAPGVAGLAFALVCLALVAPALFSRPTTINDRTM
jgi:hypothetical protein